MRPTKPFRIATTTTLLSLTAALAGCSGPGEDVRTTLCKGVTGALLDTTQPLDWRGESNKTGRWVDLEMTLTFEDPATAPRPRQVVCVYEYRSPVEENIITDTQPLSVYATRPYRVTLDGATISDAALNQAINNSILRQGKEFADKVQKGVEGAAQKIREGLAPGDSR